MDAMCLFLNNTQATDEPQSSPCAWCILLTPLGLITCESWFRVVPCHSTAWLDWFPYLRRYLDAVRVKYRKGTYSVTIVISVPWDMGTSTVFLAVVWAARSVASFEEIWDAVASSGLYSQMTLSFWWAMAGCIAIASLATTVDWFASFTLQETTTCSYNCVIEKGFIEEEKSFFPILTSISRRSTRSHISGNWGYDSNRVRFPVSDGSTSRQGWSAFLNISKCTDSLQLCTVFLG